MIAFDFLTIGHSNIAADRFVAMLHTAGVGAIADVRTTPFSRFCPWFSAKNLKPLLEQNDIGYSGLRCSARRPAVASGALSRRHCRL